MKFDCIIMNPPYQAQVKRDSENGGSGSIKSLDHLDDDIKDAEERSIFD